MNVSMHTCMCVYMHWRSLAKSTNSSYTYTCVLAFSCAHTQISTVRRQIYRCIRVCLCDAYLSTHVRMCTYTHAHTGAQTRKTNKNNFCFQTGNWLLSNHVAKTMDPNLNTVGEPSVILACKNYTFHKREGNHSYFYASHKIKA